MKFSMQRKGSYEPNDAEIERDVADLRQMLARLEEPAEPHPAYWQNFLVKVRQRVDEDGGRRRRFAPSMAWTSLAAASLVVVVAISGVLPIGNHGGTVGTPAVQRRPAEQSRPVIADNPLNYGDGTKSLMLTSDDMRMLDAILAEDSEAVLQAMVGSDS